MYACFDSIDQILRILVSMDYRIHIYILFGMCSGKFDQQFKVVTSHIFLACWMTESKGGKHFICSMLYISEIYSPLEVLDADLGVPED